MKSAPRCGISASCASTMEIDSFECAYLKLFAEEISIVLARWVVEIWLVVEVVLMVLGNAASRYGLLGHTSRPRLNG